MGGERQGDPTQLFLLFGRQVDLAPSHDLGVVRKAQEDEVGARQQKGKGQDVDLRGELAVAVHPYALGGQRRGRLQTESIADDGGPLAGDVNAAVRGRGGRDGHLVARPTAQVGERLCHVDEQLCHGAEGGGEA